MADDDTIWTTSDKALVKRYRKLAKEHRNAINLCVEECLAGWNRLPMWITHHEHASMIGLALREKDFDWSAAQKRIAKERGYTSHFGVNVPDDAPPPGWRKRVKDDYFSPPLKGGGDDADLTRALVRRYTNVPNVRALLVECGAKPYHFAGLRFITAGMDLKKGTIYVRQGPGYEIKDDRWQPMKLSEYLALEGK